MDKEQLHKLMKQEMEKAENTVVRLRAEQERTAELIEFWTRQAEAARTLSIRYHMELVRNESES